MSTLVCIATAGVGKTSFERVVLNPQLCLRPPTGGGRLFINDEVVCVSNIGETTGFPVSNLVFPLGRHTTNVDALVDLMNTIGISSWTPLRREGPFRTKGTR
jgi:hypothetical protein